MRKLLTGLGGLLLGLLAVMAFRAWSLESRQPPPTDRVEIAVDEGALAARLAEALTFPTVSSRDPEGIDAEAFRAFHAWLEATYPGVHGSMVRETVNDLSLLYTWHGSEPSLPPVVLMGHMDVVPVVPGTEEEWRHPPFGGVVADGQVWGRGALDDKISVIALLEAAEGLLEDGFAPRRTIYLAFGHDEELGGTRGARAIAATLVERGASPFAFVLDEGGAIVEDMVPGVEGPVAVVGVAEKGSLSVAMTVRGDGGHSSTPPERTSIGVLAAAVRRLEESPFPARLDGAAAALLEYLAPEMDFASRLVLANLWLTRPLVTRMMLAEPASAAMVRTTTAVTMIEGGVKENVLPGAARAVVNHRLLPGDSREAVLERDRQVVDDDAVELASVGESAEASPLSDADSAAFGLLGRTLRQVAGDEILIAPYLVVAGTDARHYAGLSPQVFRFLPARIGSGGLRLIHGTDERVAVDSLALAVRYMTQLIRNTVELSSS